MATEPERSVTACVHQPNYLPWLGFFAKLAASDVYIVLDNVQYSGGSWINRVRVRGTDPSMWLTVPIKRPAVLETPIFEIAIDYSSNWPRKHLTALQSRYGRAQHYRETSTFLRP